jgi:hypothetical protein
MNPPNILGDLPVHDEDMNLHEQPVEGEEITVRHLNFWPEQQQLTIVCTYMHHLF